MITSEDLTTFTKQLLELKATLEAEAVESAGSSEVVPLDQTRVGRLSRVDAMQSQQMALESQRRRKSMIAAIDGALERIKGQKYGLCYNCHEPITLDRLRINPVATRCIECMNI